MIGSNHPSPETLADFTRDRLPDALRRRTAQHLLGCSRCQDDLRFLRDVGRQAAAAPPRPREELLERILATRSQGVKIVIGNGMDDAEGTPTVDRPSGARPPIRVPSRTRATGWALAAAALAIAAFAIGGPRRELVAVVAESELLVEPVLYVPGERLRFRYRPAPPLFEGEERLVLRGRLRSSSDEMYTSHATVVLDTLIRDRDGSYTGEATLPDSVIYAALAVEDLRARGIDDNGGRLWEILAHDGSGPTFDALEQRLNDMMGRSWEEGYATARRMTAAYPERFGSWQLRHFFERAIYGDVAGDSLVEAYRDQMLRAREAAKSEQSLSPREIGRLFYSAWRDQANGSASASTELDYWWQRMLAEHPTHEQVAQRSAIDLVGAHRDSPRLILDSLERVHERFSQAGVKGHQNLYMVARRAAETAGDTALALRWYARQLSGRPDSSLQMALVLSRYYPIDALEPLRAELRRPIEASMRQRELVENASDYQRAREARRRNLTAALGRALIATGSTRPGLDTLAIAAASGWQPALFREIASAYSRAGEPGEAARYLSLIAVDPRTSEAERDSLAAASRPAVDADRWRAQLDSARSRMLHWFIATGRSETPRGRPRLMTPDGRLISLTELLDGKPTVVAFWSRFCAPAIEVIPALQRVAATLATAGTRVVLVTDEPPSKDLSAALERHGVTLPVHHDVEGSMRQGFASFGTPAYYVLDPLGRIRFSHPPDEETLLVQVEVLREESRLAVR